MHDGLTNSGRVTVWRQHRSRPHLSVVMTVRDPFLYGSSFNWPADAESRLHRAASRQRRRRTKVSFPGGVSKLALDRSRRRRWLFNRPAAAGGDDRDSEPSSSITIDVRSATFIECSSRIATAAHALTGTANSDDDSADVMPIIHLGLPEIGAKNP